MGATLLGQSLAAVPAIVLIGQIQHGLATLAERSIPPRPDGMFAA
jgi:hypothetical protein